MRWPFEDDAIAALGGEETSIRIKVRIFIDQWQQSHDVLYLGGIGRTARMIVVRLVGAVFIGEVFQKAAHEPRWIQRPTAHVCTPGRSWYVGDQRLAPPSYCASNNLTLRTVAEVRSVCDEQEMSRCECATWRSLAAPPCHEVTYVCEGMTNRLQLKLRTLDIVTGRRQLWPLSHRVGDADDRSSLVCSLPRNHRQDANMFSAAMDYSAKKSATVELEAPTGPLGLVLVNAEKTGAVTASELLPESLCTEGRHRMAAALH